MKTVKTSRATSPVTSAPERSTLSPRLAGVAELVACGKCDCEIAAELGLSEDTVGAYLKLIFQRFGVHTRTALAVRWLTEVQPEVATGPRTIPTNVGMARAGHTD